ncbi:hypothetical protein M3Y97_01149300 [Aphelenchoides bicaudatus]|nr:hypothetical protein M3Y97_01149300 [Aphelenchoides bicaudatus]
MPSYEVNGTARTKRCVDSGENFNGSYEYLPQIPTSTEDKKPSLKKMTESLKYIMYVTTHLVVLYTTTAAISLGSESFIHTSITNACNDSTWTGYSKTGLVIFFGVNSFIIGIASMLVLVYACCHFVKSLRKAYQLYFWQWTSGKDDVPTEKEISDRHMNFFKHVTKEIVSISASTGIIAFVGHDIESHRHIENICDNLLFVFISTWVYYLNDVYRHIAVFVCIVSLYIGFSTCAIWWYRSHKFVRLLWRYKHGCYHFQNADNENVELKRVTNTRKECIESMV